jgi:8-oxo-dGTP pyrophosphatase MutT (NUDIX family)
MSLSVVGVLLNEQRDVLVVSSRRYPGTWHLPGGKVEADDEDDFAALAREIREETSLRTVVETIHLLGEWPGVIDGWRVRVFSVPLVRGTPRYTEPGSHVAWCVGVSMLWEDSLVGRFYKEHFPQGFDDLPVTKFLP